MDGAVNPVSIVLSISVGVSLLAGLFSVWIAMRLGKGAAVTRDTAGSVFFGIAMLLIALNGIAAALIGVGGMAHIALLKVTLLFTGAFAVVGMAFGLVRGLRSGRAIKTQRA